MWCIFDVSPDDGLLCGYTSKPLMMTSDGRASLPPCSRSAGLKRAMAAFWSQYNEHNGPSAKRRASETKRKAESRIDAGDVRTKSERVADNAKKKRTNVRI